MGMLSMHVSTTNSQHITIEADNPLIGLQIQPGVSVSPPREVSMILAEKFHTMIWF